MTAVELMMAVAVLTVAVLGGASSHVASRNLVRQSTETDAAMIELQSAMEEILTLPAVEIPLVGGPYEAGQPIAAFQDRALDGQTVVATYPGWAGGALPDPLVIQLSLTWRTFRGAPRTLTLTSARAQ